MAEFMDPKTSISSRRPSSKAKERKPRRKLPQDVRVSRQRHGSTTFVVRSPTPVGVHADVTASQPPASKLRFVHNGVVDPVVWTPRAKQQDVVSATNGHETSGEADQHKESKVLFFRTEDSTWCFQPSSADLACGQLGIWNRICQQMRTLPLWSTYRVPKHLSEATPGHLKTGLDLAPELFYPFDKIRLLSWNPMREMERYLWIPKSSSILTTALMMGCLFEDVRLGRTNSPAFSALNTAACQSLNAMLAAKDRTLLLGDQAAMIICKMALAATLRGNHDDWKTHVLGLQALMNNWCKWRDLHDIMGCNAIYLADVEGALAAGQSPILSFQRRYPVIELHLAHGKLDSFRQRLEMLAIAADLHSTTRDTLLSTGIFIHGVLHARTINATYHPHHMAEAFWGLNYELLLQPSRLFPESTVKVPGTAQSLEVKPRSDTPNKLQEMSASLDATVRLSALLFLREPMAEVIFSRRGYPQILSLLATHLATLLALIGDLQVSDEDLKPTSPVSAEETTESAPNKDERHTTAMSKMQALRPFLVWSCVLGHLFSVRMGTNDPYSHIFQDMIVELCGEDLSKLNGQDLVLFQLIDNKYIFEGTWDPVKTLRHIVA